MVNASSKDSHEVFTEMRISFYCFAFEICLRFSNCNTILAIALALLCRKNLLFVLFLLQNVFEHHLKAYEAKILEKV